MAEATSKADCWVRLFIFVIPCDNICSSREIQVNDREGKLVFYVDGTLDAEKRCRLWLALNSWCTATATNVIGTELKDQDTSKIERPSFSAWHFSFYAKYGQSVSGDIISM